MTDTDPLLSQTIGNYKITGRLGRGGMSTVYRARQVNMGRDVAIKMVSAELAGDPQFITRFEREARVIANLEHPRILPVHDYGHQGGYFYLVMRLVDGESLRERLMRGPLSMAKASDFLTQIASALDYAHAKGVIHRDLKPNNILLDKLDNIYLMDFGIAKLVAASQQLTATGMVMGTPAYMAPESWRGEPVDARTDVYALGVILYEMVTSRPPFESDTPFTLMYKHLNDEPPTPREWLPELPDPVEAVILKGLAKDPNERYQTAGELATAFHQAIAGVEDLVAPPLPVEEESTDNEPDEVSTKPDTRQEPRPEAPQSAAEQDERALARDNLVVIPAPDMIQPPQEDQAARVARSVPPIPVPSGGSSLTGDEKPKRKPKPTYETALPFNIPEETPPAVRNALEWAAEKLEHVSIPGFIAPPPVPPSPVDLLPEPPVMPQIIAPGTESQWVMPIKADAYNELGQFLAPGEPLIGALYLRGTAQWRLVRRLIIALIGLNIVTAIIHIGFFSFLSFIIFVYLLIQGIRTAKGKKGRYYLGFTPGRLVVLPLSWNLTPIPDQIEDAPWDMITRLRLTPEYAWIEAKGPDALSLLALIPAHGEGDLGRQRKWMMRSPIATMLREKGFDIQSQ